MKELLERLYEERARATKGLRDFIDPITAEKRDLTAEEQQEFTRRNAELDEFDTRIREMQKRVQSDAEIDEMRAQAEQHLRPVPAEMRMDEPGALERRALEWARGGGDRVLEISLKGLRVERENGRNVVRDYGMPDLEKRTGLTETYAAGGATIPYSFRAVLYQHLILNSAVRQTRATVLTTDSGEPLIMPKTTAHPASGTIVAEGSTLFESDPTFGAGTLHAYKYGNLVQVSNELLTDTGVDLLGYLAMAMGRALGIGSGSHFVKGTGTSQPQGILVGASTVSQTTGGTGQSGVPTYKELEKVFDSIIPPYQVNAEWLLSQATVSALRQITDTLGRPLWVPSLSGGMPDTLLGKPFYIDPAMPNAGTAATSLAFGDFAAYFIRDVDGLRFERSLDYAFNTDLVTFRALIRTDGVLLDTTGAIGTYLGGTA